MGGNPRVTTTFAEHSGIRFSNHYPEPAFHDRDTYLAYRQAWKAKYGSISLEIKQMKTEHQESLLRQAAAKATVMLEELEDAKCKAAFQMGKPRIRRYHHAYKSWARNISNVDVRNSYGKKDGKPIFAENTTQPVIASTAAE